MNPFQIIFAAAAVTIAGTVSAQADAASETYKKDRNAVDFYITTQQGLVERTPLYQFSVLRNAASQLTLIKTQGLPKDLQDAFNAYVAAFGKVGDVFADWPEDAGDVPAFYQKKVAADPKYPDTIRTQFLSLQKDVLTTLHALEATEKKYGLDQIKGFDVFGK